MLLDAIDFDLWDYDLNDSFILNNLINNEIVNKLINLWTIDEKENVQQIFKSKYLMISTLRAGEYNQVSICGITKEVRDILENNYEVSTKIKKKETMNILDHEFETTDENE